MGHALQTLPRPEEACLDFEFACELASYACSLIDREFSPDRLIRIATMFDAGVRAGEQWDRSMIAAIDLEIEQYDDQIAKPEPDTRALPEEEEPKFSGLQRLPRDEERTVLALIHENNLPESVLRCEYTRQEGEGGYTTRRGRKYQVSYSLMLCHLCGNLEDSPNNDPYCPAKLVALSQRLRTLNESNPQTL